MALLLRTSACRLRTQLTKIATSSLTCRKFSSEERGPLFLWIESSGEQTTSTAPSQPPRILMPADTSKDPIIVKSPEDVQAAVESRYDLSFEGQQFVGGMGESDAGIRFASSESDPLRHWELVQESIQLVKESRHGIPFGIYTSGVGLDEDMPPLTELGLTSVQISLLAANPKDYAKATGLSEAEAAQWFGQVCNFCVASAETGFPIEVAVLKPYASAARDLATALGAIHVDVYPDE